MTRYHDWEARLADYLAGFDVNALGEAPCAFFAAGAVEAQTGFDGHAKYAGKYKTALGAVKVMKSLGGGDLPTTFDLHLDRRESPAFAQRGDIVFDGESVGVCIGRVALFVADGAWVEIPRSEWSIAWATDTAHG